MESTVETPSQEPNSPATTKDLRSDDDGHDSMEGRSGTSSEAQRARLSNSDLDQTVACINELTNMLNRAVTVQGQVLDALAYFANSLESLKEMMSRVDDSTPQPQQRSQQQQQQQQQHQQRQKQSIQVQDIEDSRRLKCILAKLDRVKKALITVEMQPFDKHTKPEIDFSDTSLDPEFLAVWCRSVNRYDYCRALCDLVGKLRAEESEERAFLRVMMRHVSSSE
ncbi:hypothetical protein BGZ80_000183 [Entomortierella chlamydospora]|uniref:Uncharacterized protein n=1 Tax=Entomortierella chlamydospora TaxID=101097 RepID=A0A9P6MSI9_9FUNG|nr:hypothetical protein BGZ79_009611 [Entomortierella chlamydospora]KAG0012134.1 hypothetical protein BGZ80_000183 [Entomortierella chlamydospora]